MPPTRGKLPTLAMTLAVLASATALAGCIGVAQASAMDERDTASGHATEWDSDARLAAILGVEGTDWGDWNGERADDYWSRAADDDAVGDGKCEVWMYRYLSPNKPDEAYVVVVDRDGEVLHQGADARQGDDRAVGEWTVDSDAAMEAAADANEGLRRGMEADHYGIILKLRKPDDDGNAQWRIMGGGGDESGGGGGVVIIDAVTGEVLKSEGGYERA